MQHKEEITAEKVYELYLKMRRENEELREDIDILEAKVAALQNQLSNQTE